MNGQAAEDLWHLTIDDLLATPADAPRLGGPGPFVINLSASTAPISLPAGGFAGFEHLSLYQLKHTEDGRTRFRLRLGPISSELEADAILAGVREHYPSAFAANAAADDLKVYQREAARAENAATTSAPAAAKEAGVAAPALENLLAPDSHAHIDVEVKGEMEAELDLEPAPPAVADSAEFVIDFDGLLPPIDPPAGSRAAVRTAAAAAAAPKLRASASAKAAAQPAAPAPAAAARTQFVEPPLDPNAVTDQVAVLTLPPDEASMELTLEDAAESVVTPALIASDEEHEIDLGMTVAVCVPAEVPERSAVPAQLVEASQNGASVADDGAVDALDLESIVARNNAMVDALQARTVASPAAELELPEQIAAQMAEPLPLPLPLPLPVSVEAQAVVLESLGQAESQAPHAPAAAVLAAIAAAPTATAQPAIAPAPAIAQTELHADIEADVDDFTSTIAGVEAEQAVDEVGDIVLEVAAITAAPAQRHAVLDTALEREPVLLVDAAELTDLDVSDFPFDTVDGHDGVEAVSIVPNDVVEEGAHIAKSPTEGVGDFSLAEVPTLLEVVEDLALVDAPTPAEAVEDLALVEAPAPVDAVEPMPLELVLADEDPAPLDSLDAAAEAVEYVEVVASVETAPVVEDAASASPAPAPVVPVKSLEILSDPMPEMDSTQTIRELTPLELADDQGSQFFAIQLSLSDEPANPDDVPHLDIFDAYRLYTVAGMHQGDFKHALRMGFFSDTHAAQAVAGYLRCYFEEPAVKRVSHAERERFSQQRVVPKRDIGATGVHTIIELSTAPRVPERRLADISNNASHRSSDSGSLWSRLVAPLKR